MVEILKELWNEEVRELTYVILVGAGLTSGGVAAKHDVQRHIPPVPAIVVPAPEPPRPPALASASAAPSAVPLEHRAKGAKVGAQ